MSIKRANVHKVLGCGQCSEHLDSYHYCNDLDACLSLRGRDQAWLTQPKLIDFLQVTRRFMAKPSSPFPCYFSHNPGSSVRTRAQRQLREQLLNK